MKAFLYFVLIIIFPGSNLFGQADIDIQSRIDSLSTQKIILESKIKEIDKAITALSLQKVQRSEKGFKVFAKKESYIYQKEEFWSPKLGSISEGDSLFVISISNDRYYPVQLDSAIGYIDRSDFETADDRNIRLRRKALREQDEAIIKEIKLQEEKDRQARIRSKYSKETAAKILDGKIWIGMTDEMARDSWGKPNSINRSVGSWGVHEQWIYNDFNMYFENDKLTSWQDHRN